MTSCSCVIWFAGSCRGGGDHDQTGAGRSSDCEFSFPVHSKLGESTTRNAEHVQTRCLSAGWNLIGWRCNDDDGILGRSEEHTSELQSRGHLVCRLLLEKKKNKE